MKISRNGRHTEKWNQIFTLIAALQHTPCAIWMTSRADRTVLKHRPSQAHTPTVTNTSLRTETSLKASRKKRQKHKHIHTVAHKVQKLTLIYANTRTHAHKNSHPVTPKTKTKCYWLDLELFLFKGLTKIKVFSLILDFWQATPH